MPTHYAMDANVVSGTVSIQSAKTASVQFLDANGNPVYFTLSPRLSITLISQSAAVPFKTSNLKFGSLFAGFTIGFQTNVTVDIEWQAFDRS